MRIWLIAENWPPRIGGIERYLTGIAGHLKGHDVTVIAPASPLLTSANWRRRPGEVSVVRRKFFYPMWPKWLPLYWFLAKKARHEKPDLIICGKALFEGRLALKLKNKFGIPFIVCTYGMEIATWAQIPRTRLQLEEVLRHADNVAYINNKTKEELLALGTSVEHLMLLYPGINSASLIEPKDSTDIVKKYSITKPYIITVARLVARKGIDDLIEAFSLLKKIPHQLVIVGDGPDRASLEAKVKQLGVNALFTGAISDEELYALYAHATLFALTPKELPCDYEGFGIVYCEAAYFGLPTVGTKTGGVPEAVENGVTGMLAEPNNPKSIAEAIEKLLTDTNLAKQYGEAGKKRVIQQFTWSATMRIFNDYLSVIPASEPACPAGRPESKHVDAGSSPA